MATTSNRKPIPKTKMEVLLALKDSIKNKASHGNNFNISGRQKLLCSVLASDKIKRSSTRGFILLMGSSGVGKSSTINHIFNFQTKVKKEFARTSWSQSETSDIQEYVYTTESGRYETSDLTLGIVDTPGFGDTGGGIRQDACNLTAISEFVQSHPNLKGNYPNLILICFNATDVRFEGPSSNFAKLLKCVRKLNLVDKDKPNVIIVMTNSCSVVPNVKDNVEEWKRKIRRIKLKVKQIVLNAIEVDVPIIPIENHYADFQLRRPALSNGDVGDFTELPDGQLQPLNLFQTCSDMLRKNKDLFGQICFSAIFVAGKNLQPTLGYRVESSKSSSTFMPLSEKSRYLKFLEDINHSRPLKNAFKEKSEMYIRSKSLDDFSKQEIECLVDDINESGFFEERDIKSHSVNTIEYHLGNDLTNIQRDFLQNYLKMKVFDPDSELADKMQCGFNVFSDTLCGQVFHEALEMKRGILVPRNAVITNISKTEHFAEFSTSESDFFAKRIDFLHGVKMNIRETDFRYNRRPGFHIIDSTTDQSSLERTYYEKRFYKIDLDFHNTKFSAVFVQSVSQLPDEYNSKTSIAFVKFFEDFGHYIIKRVYAGGSYEKSSSRVVCIGGNSKYEKQKSPLDRKEKIIWEQSIISHPKLLTTTMYLEPISKAVQLLDMRKAEVVVFALKDIFHEGDEFDDAVETSLDMDDLDRSCLTREEAVEEEETLSEKVIFGIVLAIFGLLAIVLFPITIIAFIVLVAKVDDKDD